jgi:cation-transporting ATPase 13A2
LELGVIRTFEFVASLRRMSVIVKRLKSNAMEVYVKGAPEVMEEICEKDSCMASNYMLWGEAN